MKKENEFIQEMKAKKSLEKEKLKNMNLREKLDYIWTYYKIHIIIILILAACLFSFVKYLVSDKKESIMYSVAVNANYFSIQEETDEGVDQPDLYQNFLASRGYDPNKYQIDANTALAFKSTEEPFNSDPQSFAVLTTLLMAGTTDNLIADENVFNSVSKNGIFLPLSEYLSAEEIKQYEDYIIYATDPETSEKYACGILLENSRAIKESSMFYTTPVVGVINGSPNQDVSIEFVRYLLEE